jgi:ribonuclease P protein component
LKEPRRRFGKNRRLLKKDEYDRVFAGKDVYYGTQTIIRKIPNGLGTNRIGLVVKRKTAIERNGFKRVLREAFRQMEFKNGTAFDVVAIARTGAVPEFAAVQADLRGALGVQC